MKSALWFMWGGRLLCLFGLIYTVLELNRWLAALDPSLLTLAAGTAMIGLGCSLMDAARLKVAREWIAGEVMASWVLLSLSFMSAIVIIVASSIGEPRLMIALVFSGAFLLSGGALYWFGRKSRRPGARVLKSAAQAQDDKDIALVGHLDWRDGTLIQDHAQKPRRIWPGALALAAGLPALGLALFGAYGFGVFGALFTMIGAWLLYTRWAGRKRMSRFGVSTLIIEDRPLHLKNGVKGRLIIPVRPEGKIISARLTCVRRRRVHGKPLRSGGRADDYYTFDTLFDQEISARLTGESRGECEISFEPPKGLPSAAHLVNAVVWKLVVTAEHPGMDYRAEFSLPVRA